jgi:segregation and condensation protein B
MDDSDEHASLPSAEEMAEALRHMPTWQVDVVESADETAPSLPNVPGASATDERIPPSPSASPEVTNLDSPPPLSRILEALLFIGGPPLTASRASEVVSGLGEQEFHEAIYGLSRTYRAQGRPYQVHLQGHGYVLALRARFARLREKLHGGVREARLSQAAVDVLSLIAYRQPATREEVDALRGADSASLLRLLVRHGLIAIERGEDKEARYFTTPRFLQLFGLSSLDDLPQTQDLQRL